MPFQRTSFLFLAGVATGLLPTQRLPVASSPFASSRASSLSMVGTAALVKKQAAVAEIQDSMKDAALMFCVRSEGIPVNEMSALRQSFPEDVTIKVCKNNLIKIAAQGEGFERFAEIAGEEKEITRMSNIWFYVPEDKMKDTVKGWEKHCKEFSGNEIRNSAIIGGAFDGAILDAKGVDAVSKLPTKQELMQSTAIALKQTSVKLARVLKQAGAAQRIATGVKEAQGSKLARAVNAMSAKLGD
jgi:large subunit ribosomal protein L10